MNLKRELIEVETRFDVIVRSLFIHREPVSSQLLVLLPGRNYTCDRPLLHYLRALALQHGWDVLSVQYSFHVAEAEPTEAELWSEVRAALQQALSHGYQAVCFAGKSMGSTLAVKLSRTLKLPRPSLLLLSPLETAVEHLNGLPALLLIGTADPLYASPALQAARNAPGVEWHEFADLDHSLEARGDWQRSVAALPQVIGACERFLGAGVLSRQAP